MYTKLKILKYYILHHKLCKITILIFKLIFFLKFLKVLNKKQYCKGLGNFRSTIKLFDYEEIQILIDNNYIHPNLQSLRNFEFDKYELVLNSNKEITKKFLQFNLKENFLNFNNKLKIKKKIFLLNEKKNIFIPNNIKKFTHLILSKYKLKNIKQFYCYDYEKGRILNSNLKRDSYYKIYSKKKIYINNKKKKLSGFSTLRTISLYPFDLSFESVLPHVDEFVLGVDTAYYNNNNKIALKKFLNKTRYKNKIKIFFFNFKSSTTLKMYNRFRWLVDANNKVLNHCNGEYCFYIQSDEFYNYNKIKLKNVIKNYDEVLFDFKHYIFNFETIINERNASYNKSIRIFKKDLYCSSHDGFNFEPLYNFTRPNILSSPDFQICHFNLIFKYKEKINHHFVKKNALHKNLVNKKEFYEKYLVPRKFINPLLYENLKSLNYLPNYKYIKNLLI